MSDLGKAGPARPRPAAAVAVQDGHPMTQVYIVERGEQYEGSYVVGVFATKELAERYAHQEGLRDRDGYYHVSEPEEVIDHLETVPDPPMVTVYHANFQMGDDITITEVLEPVGLYGDFEKGFEWCQAFGTDRDRVVRYTLREAPRMCDFWNCEVPAKVRDRIANKDYSTPEVIR